MATSRPDAVHKKRAKRFQGKQPEQHFRDGPCPTPTKIAHPTRLLAKRAKRLQKKQPGVRYMAFKCICGAYHVGSQRLQNRAEAQDVMRYKTRLL